MNIKPSSPDLMNIFCSFWNDALEYQKSKAYPVWPEFSEKLISREIAEGNHFSAYDQNKEIIGYFSIAHEDPIVWKEKETGNAIYIHRMVINPDKKGFRFTENVLGWSINFASQLQKKFVRMDTWGDNSNLIRYYESCGFNFVSFVTLGDEPLLPKHYSNIKLALFENYVNV